jgi:lysophospholipase L1-like esterase
VDLFHGQLPDSQIAIVSVKPSPSRLDILSRIERLNALLQRLAAERRYLTYLDVYQPMRERSRDALADLFFEDGLHMNRAGYDVWRVVVERYLASAYKAQVRTPTICALP